MLLLPVADRKLAPLLYFLPVLATVAISEAFLIHNVSYRSLEMPFAQLRSAGLPGHVARHVKAARAFSTGATLRKELQDAYILSASRTPTAKVRC